MVLTLRFPNGPCIFHNLRGFKSFQSPTSHTGSPYTEYSTDQDMVLASDIFHCPALLALYKSSKTVGKLQYNAYSQPLQGNFPARDSVLLNFSIVKFISKFPLFPASLISSIYRSECFFYRTHPRCFHRSNAFTMILQSTRWTTTSSRCREIAALFQ
jgi:hypothetical protein